MRSTFACLFDVKGGTILHIDFNRDRNSGTNAMAGQTVVMISVPTSAMSQLMVVNMSPRELVVEVGKEICARMIAGMDKYARLDSEGPKILLREVFESPEEGNRSKWLF